MKAQKEIVRVNIEDGVGVITLNDPTRRNPLSIEMKEGILEGLEHIREGNARCLIVQGADDAFCAGGDINQMMESADGGSDPGSGMDRSHRLSNEIVSEVASLPIPVVMKIDGPAVGGGAGLALAGDIRLASDRAKVGFTFRNVGLSIDDGTSYYLPRIVGQGRAKELVFTGRILDAKEAYELRLVQNVYPTAEFEERCAEFVAEISTGPTEAMALMKQLLNRSGEKTLEEALEDELVAQKVALASDDHQEGLSAFVDDREPEFTGK